MNFGQQVLSTRQALHLTQAELARVLERTTQTVSNWECEVTAPWPREQTKILSRLLDLSHAAGGVQPTLAIMAGQSCTVLVPEKPVKLPSRRTPVGDRL